MRARLLTAGAVVAVLSLSGCSQDRPHQTTLSLQKHFGTTARLAPSPRPTGVRRASDEGRRNRTPLPTVGDEGSDPTGPNPPDVAGRWGRYDDADSADGTTIDDPTGRGWDDGYADDGYADDGYADDGYADDGYADDGYADDGYTDDGYTDDGYTDDANADDSYTDDGYADDGYADNGYADDGYAGCGSAAADASLAVDGSECPPVDATGAGGEVTEPATSTDLDGLVADIRGAWNPAVPGTSTRIVVVPSGKRVATACADGTTSYAAADDAFYCDLDDTVVVGADLLAEVQHDFGAGGVAYLLAHEYGHNLQLETGVVTDDAATAKPVELHADCLAGAYLADAVRRGSIAPSALDQARAAAYSVGDDDISDPDHHGTAQERRDAVDLGISGGDCVAFLR